MADVGTEEMAGGRIRDWHVKGVEVRGALETSFGLDAGRAIPFAGFGKGSSIEEGVHLCRNSAMRNIEHGMWSVLPFVPFEI